MKDLSFEERIRLKQRSGFDHYVTKKSEILKRKEQREEFEKKVKKERESSKKQASSSKKQQKKQMDGPAAATPKAEAPTPEKKDQTISSGQEMSSI